MSTQSREYTKNVFRCYSCRALHFNPDGPCPDCGAGCYFQCDEKDAFYPAALREKAIRLRKRADELDAEALEVGTK